MAAPQASSRLEMLQARFQQKQLQEKEQKLLQLYDQQQQRAYQVVQRGSAGSTGSNHSSSVSHQTISRTTTTHSSSTSQGGGKVRQMFDERRQTTVKGIDRSYPLEPLDNKPMKQVTSNGHVPGKGSNATVNRHSVTVRRVARADVNSNVNGGKPVVSYHEEVTHESFGDDDEFGNENHNGRYPNGDHDNANRNEVHIEEILDDDTIQRNRLMAKVHLMNFDKTMKYRVNNDLESEQFPEELMLDVPDKLPKRAPTRKISQAEARLERFKNANARKSNVSKSTTTTSTVTRKRSEPMFPAGTSSREPLASTRITKTMNTMKPGRSEGPTRKRNESTSPEVISKNAEPTKIHRERPKISQDTKAGIRITLKMEKIVDSAKKDDTMVFETRTVERQCRRSDSARVQSGYRQSMKTGFNETEVKIVGKPTSFTVEKTESRTASDDKIPGSVKIRSADGTGSVEIIEKKRKPGFSGTTVIRKSDKRNESKRSYAQDINSMKTKSKHEIDTAKNVKSKIISNSPKVIGTISKVRISRESSPDTTKPVSKERTVPTVDKSYTRIETSSSGKAATPELIKRRVSNDSIARAKTSTERRGSVERSKHLKSDITVHSAELVKKVMRNQSIEQKSDIVDKTALNGSTKKSERSISQKKNTELRKTLISDKTKEKIEKDSRKQIKYPKKDITSMESVTKESDSIGINIRQGDIDKSVVSNKIRDSRRGQSLDQSRGTPRFSQKKLKYVGSGHDPKEVDDVRIERIEEKKDVMPDGRRSKGSTTRVDIEFKTHQSLGHERQLSEIERMSGSKARIKTSRSPSVEERKSMPIEISTEILKNTTTRIESEFNRRHLVNDDSTRSRINETMKFTETQKNINSKKSRESSIEKEDKCNIKNKKTAAISSPRKTNKFDENMETRPTSPVRRLCRNSMMEDKINLKQSGSATKDKRIRIPKSSGKFKSSTKPKSLISHSKRNEEIKTKGKISAKQTLYNIESLTKSRRVSETTGLRKSEETVESSSGTKCEGTGKPLRSIELVRKAVRNQSPGVSRKLEESIIRKSGSLESTGLESEEIKKSAKTTGESARMKSNESSKIKVSSDEQSPKSSISAEIDTDSHEILIADQSIKREKSSMSERSSEALSTTLKKGTQSKAKTKEMQSKTASASKIIEIQSDKMITQSTQDHATFLIRRPCKKRGTVLNSDIYEQQEVGASKQVDYTGSRKIERNSTHGKISKYDKANALKIQRKDISERSKSPDLKRSGREKSKVTVPLARVELEETLISAELVRRAMDNRKQENTSGSSRNAKSTILKKVHSDEAELTPEYQEISITDQFIKPDRNRLEKQKEDVSSKETEQKRRKTIKDVKRVSVDLNKTKRTMKIVAKPKVIGPRRRICSKLIRQMETNLKKQPAKASTTYKKIIMTKERSNIRESSTTQNKSPKIEISERPSSRLSGTVEFDSIKKQPVAIPQTRKPALNAIRTKSSEATRGEDCAKIPGKSTEKQETLKSPQLMQKVMREQSPEHRSVSSESINLDREISEFETIPIIISKEPEQREHKIVKKQEAIFSPSKKPRSTSKPTYNAVRVSKKIVEETNQKQRTGSVGRICLKLVADKQSNVMGANSSADILKRPNEIKVSSSIKATIKKPVQRPHRVNNIPKVVRLTDVPANGRASSSRQTATVSRKQIVKSVGKNLPRYTQTRHVSKDSLSPEDSELKRAPTTKTLRSTALVQSAMKKQTSEITKINTTQRDSTKSIESLENVKIVEDKIAKRPLTNVGLKRKSRPPNLNLEIIQKSKRVESTVTEKPIERERTLSTNKKISSKVKTDKVKEVEQSKTIEPEAKSSRSERIFDSDEKSFQDKLINALTKTINERTTPYIVSSPDPSRIERLYPRYPVEEEVLSSSDIVKKPAEIQNNVPPVKCESTDSVESALRRFDSIGTDTDQQEIIQGDTADDRMIDIRVAQGLTPKPESPKARISVKNGTTGTDQSKSVTVIKGYVKPIDTSSERSTTTTRKVMEKKIPEIARVGVKKYSSETQPIRRNVTSEKKEKRISIISSAPIEKTPESGIGKISIAALDTPLQDFESKQRKIAKARNSVELARTSVQIQKPSWRRKLFEDSDSGVETEVVRPRSVNFDEDERINTNLKSTDVIKGKSEILECVNRISKIPVPRVGFRSQQLQSATPLRSIEVIRKSIRKEKQDQLRKTIPEEPDSKKVPSRNQKSVTNETRHKMTKPIISKIAQDNRGTVQKVVKASITQMASKPKNSQTIGSKSNYDKAVTIKSPTVSQKSHSKNTINKVETKFQRAKPSPVFFEYSTSLTRERNANYNTKRPAKPPKSKETKPSIDSEKNLHKKNTKLSHKGLQVKNSVNSSPREKDLHEFKRKQTKPISTRRSTAPLFSQSDKKFKITSSPQPNVTRRQSTGSNLETVKDKSSLADSLYKETIKSNYFMDKDENQDATSKKKILKSVTDKYRSDSLDSLDTEYKHKESSSARHKMSHTQSSNQLESSRSACRISQSTFAVDSRSESPDSLEAEHIYSRQIIRNESFTGLEQSTDRDQSPSPDSLDEACKYYTNTRNKYRTADQIQTSGYSRISTKITVESRTASEDSLESTSKYSKSIEIQKISRECTESPESDDKGQSTREFHETTIPHEQYLKRHGNNSKTLKQQETLTKSPAPALRVSKTPSPDPALRKGADSNSRTPAASARRSAPQSPTKSPEVAARQVSAEVKNSVARASKKTPSTLTRSLDTSANRRATPDVPKTGDSVDASNRENNSQSENSISERKFDGEALPSIPRKNEAFALEFDAFGEPTGDDPTAARKPPARKQVPEKLSGPLKQRSPTATPYPRPVSSLSTASSSSSARGQTSAIAKGKMATKAKSKSPAPGALSSGPKASARSGGTTVSNDNLAECKICGRRFAQERIALHEQICAKTGQKKRKQFDAMMFRVKGTDLEPFVRKGASKKTESKNKKPEVKSNWRKKHEDFINAIRSAKQVQAHLAAGGKLSDLPPPPVSDTSDYIQCPHCGRKFNQSAAERHIPKCETMLHNKPNPRAPPKPKR